MISLSGDQVIFQVNVCLTGSRPDDEAVRLDAG